MQVQKWTGPSAMVIATDSISDEPQALQPVWVRVLISVDSASGPVPEHGP
jgi:hypothetical protein